MYFTLCIWPDKKVQASDISELSSTMQELSDLHSIGGDIHAYELLVVEYLLCSRQKYQSKQPFVDDDSSIHQFVVIITVTFNIHIHVFLVMIFRWLFSLARPCARLLLWLLSLTRPCARLLLWLFSVVRLFIWLFSLARLYALITV